VGLTSYLTDGNRLNRPRQKHKLYYQIKFRRRKMILPPAFTMFQTRRMIRVAAEKIPCRRQSIAAAESQRYGRQIPEIQPEKILAEAGQGQQRQPEKKRRRRRQTVRRQKKVTGVPAAAPDAKVRSGRLTVKNRAASVRA
jgi:hypothetical protein